MESDSSYSLVAVVGPTGTGKSDLALHLAAAFDGEIVNCDSVQVYRALDIGSAKTQPSQRSAIPHHLLDIIDPADELTAGAYARLATAALHDIRNRKRLPIVVGGTGFYLRALIEGLSPGPERDEELRSRLSAIVGRRPGLLHRFLRTRDPDAALRIHPNDHQKLIRAIELGGKGARPVRQSLAGFRVLKIALNPPRALLHERLNARTAAMFANGLLEETQKLLAGGLSPTAKSLQTLGYRQAVAVLTNAMPLAQAVIECQTQTRQYAKRQMTWFRHEAGVQWLAGFGSEPTVQQAARALVGGWLGRR